jgi:hypothetical protein
VTRWVSGTNASRAAEEAVYLVVLADLDFSSGHVRVHDGGGDLVFGGNTFSGIGTFGSLEMIEENVDTIARGVLASLSGIESSLIATVMTEVYQGRAATFYLGLLNESLQFVDTPEEIWSGRMDTMSITLAQRQASIRLACEHRLRREPQAARMTDEDLQLQYSGDTFFGLMAQIPLYKAAWGDKPNSFNAPVFDPSSFGLYGF